MSWDTKSVDEMSKIPLRNGIWKGEEFQGRGNKIVNMKELFGYDFIGSQEMRRIELTNVEIEKNTLEEGDLLFARRSVVADGAGKTSIVRGVDDVITFESSIIRVRLNSEISDPLFYYYYFKSNIGRSHVLSLSTGANVKGIKGSELKLLKIPFPPLATQKKIASILSAYDDLIENNLKRIKLLEEAAQNIYKEWFVSFRFPEYENVKFENGLPIGWEIKLLENEIDIIKRKSKINTDGYQAKGKYPIIDQAYGDIAGYTDDGNLIHFSPLPIVVFGDHTRRVKFVDFPFASGADGTQLLYPLNRNLNPYYFFYAIKNIDLSNYAYARHFKFLKQQSIIIPDNFTLSRFNTILTPLMNQIKNLKDQNIKLKEASDILLPRLMNRTIEV